MAPELSHILLENLKEMEPLWGRKSAGTQFQQVHLGGRKALLMKP